MLGILHENRNTEDLLAVIHTFRCLQGIGTNEDELNRVVISRCEVDMIQIKDQYEELMKRSLEDHVSVC